MKMKLSDFDFHLPTEQIASHPADFRDDARLMVVHRSTGEIEHKHFKDITDYFDEGDVFVLNDAKVFPARLYGQKEKTGAKIEVFLLRELNAQYHLWDVNVDPARKIRVGNKLYFGDDELVAEVIDNTTSRGRTIRFLFDGTTEEFMKKVDALGETPIPLKKEDGKPGLEREVEPEDRERFQTIYANPNQLGAVCAPAAGLHFTKQVFKRMELKGIGAAPITVNVGLGSFRPLEQEDLNKYKADSELFAIPLESAKMVNAALDARKRVLSVGATTMRGMESSVTANNRLKNFSNWTDRFVYPPYEFKVANCLLTNLHPPMTTPVIMAATFGGHKLVMDAYRQAVEMKYRFFVYGDAMLIL